MCVQCKGTYHYGCLNITTADFMRNQFDYTRSWTCPECKNITKRKLRTDETPVKSLHELSGVADMSCDDVNSGEISVISTHSSSPKKNSPSPCTPPNNYLQLQASANAPVSTAGNITYEQFAALLDAKLDEKLDPKLQSIRVSVTEDIKQEFQDVIKKMDHEIQLLTDRFSAEINSIRDDVDVLSSLTGSLKTENEKLKKELEDLRARPANYDMNLAETVSHLQLQLNEKEQDIMLNDIEISGVPEFSGETPHNICIAIAAKLGVTVTVQDVVFAERVGLRKWRRTPNNEGDAGGAGAGGSGTDGLAGGTPLRPRPIAVRLTRRALRDELLRAARVRRSLNTSDIGLPAHNSTTFYVNERLTRSNRVLFGKAREMGKVLDWRFVWTKNGRVYAKRSESFTSQARLIKSVSDLERVFGVEKGKKTE